MERKRHLVKMRLVKGSVKGAIRLEYDWPVIDEAEVRI
jgi:hypothetical protein